MGLPEACVVDTNIWIDLAVGELLAEVFHLPIRFLAPDVLIHELEYPAGDDLRR